MTSSTAPGSPESASPPAPTPDAETAAGTPPAKRSRTLLIGLLLAIASAALYWSTVDYPLVYDDYFLIANNESMFEVPTDYSAALELFGKEYWEGVNPDLPEALRTRGQALYRPLTLFMWATVLNFEGQRRGADPIPAPGFHALNLVFNAWVVYLLFVLVQRLFGSTRLAVVTALLFAAHPLHSEAVAYVAGLSDVLAAATVLLGLVFFERATRNPDKLAIGPYVGMLATMFVGLLAKEQGVLVLAAVALTDLVISLQGRGPSAKQRLAIYGGLVVVLLAHVFIRYAAMGYLTPDRSLISRLDNPLVKEDWDVRAINAFKLIARYLWLALWPKDLSIDYSFNAIPTSYSWTSPEPFAGLLVVASLIVFGLAKLRRNPPLAWGLLFFVGTALFTSNLFVPIGTIFAERLMYIPTIGLALAVAAILELLLSVGQKSEHGMNPLGLLAVVLIVGALGMRTVERNADFERSVVLFEAAEKVVPDSARVQYQLGSIYGNQRFFSKAVEKYEEALRLDDSFIPAAIKLGDVYLLDFNYDRAIETYDRILTGMKARGVTDPAQLAAIEADIYSKRAVAHRGKGDEAAAMADLQLAMERGGEFSGAPLQLALAYQEQDKFPEMIQVLQQGLAFNPDNVQMLTLLVRAASAAGDKQLYDETLARLEAHEAGRATALALKAEVKYEQSVQAEDEAGREVAMSMFEEAIRLDDTLATPYIFRGRYMVERSRAYVEAILDYDRAIDRDPKNTPAYLFKADAQQKAGLLEEALATLRALEQVKPGWECYALMSEVAFRLGDLEAQEEALKKIKKYGKEPLAMINNRAQALHQAGESQRALDVLAQALVTDSGDARGDLLKTQGLIYYALGQYDEALLSFQQEEQTYVQGGDATDPRVVAVKAYNAINKARALLGLGRDAEAMAQLDQAESMRQAFAEDDPQRVMLRSSILRWTARLALDPGGAFYDPTRAETACEEGFDITMRRDPGMFELSIAALAASDDLADALARAEEASALFRGAQSHFPTAVEALQKAIDGDREGAIADLLGSGVPALERIGIVMRG